MEAKSLNVHSVTRTGFDTNRVDSSESAIAVGRRNVAYVPSITVAAFCLVGTGGLFTPEMLHARDGKGYRFPDVRFVDVRPTRNFERRVGAPECLARIKAVFRTSMTELAAMFGVSRQAIYNWQAGHSVSDDNLRKLISLNEAADLVSRFGLEAGARRALPGGKYVAEEVMGGTSAAVAVATLGALLRQDQRERDSLLSAGLTDVSQSFPDLSGAGLPKLDERG